MSYDLQTLTGATDIDEFTDALTGVVDAIKAGMTADQIRAALVTVNSESVTNGELQSQIDDIETELSGIDTTKYYDIRVGFSSSPSSGEVIDTFPIVRDVTFAADFLGSIGTVGIAPSSSFSIAVNDDGVEIGTITVSTSGEFTFSTTSTTETIVSAGSIITVVAPSSGVSSAANLVLTLAGTA